MAFDPVTSRRLGNIVGQLAPSVQEEQRTQDDNKFSKQIVTAKYVLYVRVCVVKCGCACLACLVCLAWLL
jgi:hypothetical protein